MSNEPTIAEKNRAICEFMGLIPIPAGTKMLGDIKHPEESEAFLNYHERWELLMPVYHAIREKAYALRSEGKAQKLWAKLNSQLLFGNIADVHLRAFRFIEHVNKQSTTTNERKSE